MNRFIKNVTVFFVTGLLFILPGCSSCSQGGPSALDPYWDKEGQAKTYPSKKFRTLLPTAAGQYIVVGYLKGVNRDHIEKQTVVRKDTGGWVNETINIDRKGKITGSQQLQGFEYVKKGNSTVKIAWIKMLYEDGTVERIEQEIVPEMEQYADFLGKFMPSSKEKADDKIAYLDDLPVTVPAGIFKGTTVFTTEKTIKENKKIPKIHLYPDVPITGIVKMADANDIAYMELIDFGKNGKPDICTCTQAGRHKNHSCGK